MAATVRSAEYAIVLFDYRVLLMPPTIISYARQMGISFYWLSEHVTGLQRCLFASTGRRVVIAFNVQAKSRCSPQPIERIRNKMSITFGPDLWDLPGLGAISIGIGPRAAICTSILGSTRRFGCNRFGTSSSRTIYGRTLIAMFPLATYAN